MSFKNSKIELDCDTIISLKLTWIEAKEMFNLNEGNIQKVYLRYIINKYGIKTAKLLLCD